MDLYLIAILLLVLLFLFSGVQKLFNINGTADVLKNKININFPHWMYVVVIIIVIAIQIGCSSSLIYYAATKKHATLAYYSTILLLCFTVLATIIFHIPPIKTNYHPCMSNISLVGGLLLVLHSISENNKLHN